MNRRRKNCVLLPAAGKSTQFFLLLFTEPGVYLLGHPSSLSQDLNYDPPPLVRGRHVTMSPSFSVADVVRRWARELEGFTGGDTAGKGRRASGSGERDHSQMMSSIFGEFRPPPHPLITGTIMRPINAIVWFRANPLLRVRIHGCSRFYKFDFQTCTNFQNLL